MNVCVPSEAYTSTSPVALSTKLLGLGPMEVQVGWELPRWKERCHSLDCGPVEDSESSLLGALVCSLGSSMSDGQIINEDAVSFLIGVADGPIAPVSWESSVEQVVVVVEQLSHLILLENSVRFRRWVSPDDGTCHAQMEPDCLSSRDSVLVDKGVENSSVRVDRGVFRPLFLGLFWQDIKGSPLVREMGVTTVFGNSDDVIPDVAECLELKRAVVVPLWTDALYPVPWVVAQSENVLVWGLWVHTMGAMDSSSSPVLTRCHLLIPRKHSLPTEHKEPSLCHLLLQYSQYLLARLLP